MYIEHEHRNGVSGYHFVQQRQFTMKSMDKQVDDPTLSIPFLERRIEPVL